MVLLVQMSQETLETDTQKQETGMQADERKGSSDNALCKGGGEDHQIQMLSALIAFVVLVCGRGS